MNETEKPNPIEQALESIEGAAPEIAKELFMASPEDIILKSDLVSPENTCIVKLRFADRFLNSCGLPSLYKKIEQDLLFSNVSLDRQSRREFVEVNSRKMSNFQVPGNFDSIETARK